MVWPKPITLEIRKGWSKDFLGSSFPNHDSKSIKEEENKNKTKDQGQTAFERVRAQGISTNNNLYDACNEYTYNACSNAQKTCSISQHLSKIDLNKEF